MQEKKVKNDESLRMVSDKRKALLNRTVSVLWCALRGLKESFFLSRSSVWIERADTGVSLHNHPDYEATKNEPVFIKEQQLAAAGDVHAYTTAGACAGPAEAMEFIQQ